MKCTNRRCAAPTACTAVQAETHVTPSASVTNPPGNLLSSPCTGVVCKQERMEKSHNFTFSRIVYVIVALNADRYGNTIKS